ncbi:predicted protein [Lichtheimia corymbifera JMRC:FSU:9682]|uniref:Uncharacterized protein n=1 Tax=Lichtheimia corymbifera JMRC:FSU:9682 TaxID=1263082 RepID=A0A068SGJ0_9FUNG|nr:predicted protein [Lichtheimia corymbifera JMRC:FSU:9682]
MSSNSASNSNANRDASSANRDAPTSPGGAGIRNGRRPQVIIKTATTTVNSLTAFFDKELEENRAWAKVDIVDNANKLIDRECMYISK